MKTVIYRTGQMRVPTHHDYVLEHGAEFDSRRPEGHLSRSEALFAAPDIHGGHHWLYDGIALSNRGHRYKAVFNEITVESDNVRVYCVNNFNMVGDHYGNPTPEQITGISNYWNTSMTLTDWLEEVGQDLHGQWEVLLPKREVISSRAISYTELREMYEQEGMDDERMDELAELRMPLEASEISSHSRINIIGLKTRRTN